MKDELYTNEYVDPDPVVIVPDAKTYDDNWYNAKVKWQPSDQCYSSIKFNDVLERFDSFNQILFKSWDELFYYSGKGSGGTILRLQHNKTHQRTNDFNLTMMRKGFQRNLKPNMDYLREEIQCDISKLDEYKFDNGIEIYTASTKDEFDGCIQLILCRIGKDYAFSYVSFCDQLFMPIVNKIRLNELNSAVCLEFTQEFNTNKLLSMNQVVEYQRSVGK